MMPYYHRLNNVARFEDSGTTTTATSITTDNTSTDAWAYGTGIHQLRIDQSGALYCNAIPPEEFYAKPKRFIDQLRKEIGDWHGDILRAA